MLLGASMGGLDALRSLVGRLPGDLPAAVLIVLHTSDNSPGTLAAIFDRAGPLPAAFARDGEPIQPGRIYVAPPGAHLLVTEPGLRLSHSARENRARPALDPLFRTAAVVGRSRVVGVVLTGLLDDGASGLQAVNRCGGIALVQDPADAEFPAMPTAALRAVPDAHRVPLVDLPDAIVAAVARPAGTPPPVPAALAVEARITAHGMTDIETMDGLGSRVPVSCPDCGGSLWSVGADPVRFRCHTGHAYTSHALADAQADALEQALLVALRTLEERSRMLRRMADEYGAGHYDGTADETDRHAEVLRDVLLQTRD